MKPEELVKKIKLSILDKNQIIYKDLFQNTDIKNISDLIVRELLVSLQS